MSKDKLNEGGRGRRRRRIGRIRRGGGKENQAAMIAYASFQIETLHALRRNIAKQLMKLRVMESIFGFPSQWYADEVWRSNDS